MDKQYTQEEINELVNWFNDKELPTEFQINDATYSPDLPETIKSISTQINNNWQNPTFNGNIRQLNEIKNKLEGNNFSD